MKMKFIVIVLILALSEICFAQKDCHCAKCKGLEDGDTFYNLTSSDSNPRAKRALKGTKRVLYVPVGELGFQFSISGSERGSDFNISRLCMWTRNVATIGGDGEGMYVPDQMSVQPSGAVEMRGTGPGMMTMVAPVPVDNPKVWSRSCITRGMHSVIRLFLRAASPEARMMVKGLHMHACPRQRGMPTPECDNQQRLSYGSSYFNFEATPRGSALEGVLDGSRRAVMGRPGEDMSFTITPPQGDNGFVMTSLCMDTHSTNQVLFAYQGAAMSREIASSVTQEPALNREAIPSPPNWTRSCVGFSQAMYSQVTLTIRPANTGSRVRAKGLVMTACPWRDL